MRDIRIETNPVLAGTVYYLGCVATFLMCSSTCVALHQGSFFVARLLGLVHTDFYIWGDCVLRAEILLLLQGGCVARWDYKFHRLGRTLPISSGLVADALRSALLIYTAKAAFTTLAWLASKYFMGHEGAPFWPIAFQLVAYLFVTNMVATLLRYEKDAPLEGAAVLTMAEAQTHLAARTPRMR